MDSTTPQLSALDELQKSLSLLEKQTLPMPTRAALSTAKRHLQQLRNTLQRDPEANRLAALYRVSQSLGVSLDLDEVLTQVMDAVIQLTGAERGFLMLIEPEGGELSLRAARNIQQENLQQEDMKVSRTVIQSVIESGQGVVTTNAQSDPRFAGQESVIFYALRSVMCAPLRSRGNIIGVIYVDNRAQAGIFGNEDLNLLNAFAGQAAVAIENAQLYTQTDRALADRVAELETLSRIDQDLNAQLDLERVVELTRQWAIRVTQASKGWVAVCDDEGELHIVASPPGETPPELEPLLTAANQADPVPRQLLAREGKPAYCMTPLIHNRQTIGAVIVAHPQGISESAQQFLKRLADRAAAAVQNARLYQAVEAANEAKSQFVSIVTHELRIPLTSIKGYNDLIRQGLVGEINEQQANFLDVIGSNVERMSRLISDLSDISRIERGKLRLEFSHFPLQERVDETINSLRHKLEEKSQTITTEIPPSLPHVYADPSRVVQVLTNLVSNAWKYTPEGGKIHVRAYPEDGRVRVEVRDTGIGISEEDQARLFTQFFRSESPAVREQTGWGLGLNVTRRLVEVMGGTIGFESKLGEGSTFWFTLPTSAALTSQTHEA